VRVRGYNEVMDVTVVRRAVESEIARSFDPQHRFAVRHLDGTPIGDVTRPGSEEDLREAGVLVLLFPRDGELYLVLTKRTDHLVEHAGQISFPGGAREEEDGDLVETALREAAEEIGVATEEVHVIGELAPVYIYVSNFKVIPVVGLVKEPVEWIPDPFEVAEVLEVPVRTFLDEEAVEEEEREFRFGTKIVPYFRYEEHKIWGATARMINTFADSIRAVLD
jgi:8-oxo-dGTP pyrophosphatase MutT (NUDIX family)